MAQLRPIVARLKLSGLLSMLDVRIKEAAEHKQPYADFLLGLFQDEVERRNAHAMTLRMKRGNLIADKTIEAFDFLVNAKVPERVIRELATANFVERAENVILIGPSGVGKSHLAQALAHEAVRHGYDAWFERTTTVLQWLNSGRADATYDRKLKHLLGISLLVLDDFGLTELNTREQMDLYELICGRHESKATIITSNRDVGEWFSLFQNPLLASAAIDRLVHRAVRLTIDGESYRLRQSKMLNSRYAEMTD
jgi:DNA replication protein DnaC